MMNGIENEIKSNYFRLQRENETLRKTIGFLLKALNQAVVVRDDELDEAPDIDVFENISGEMVIKAKE